MNVAYLPILADRYGAMVRQIYIRGLDLTGIVMRAQVRSGGDVPGAPLVDLQTVTNGNAEGLRLVEVTSDAGVPVSHIEMVINETTMEALPYIGELGSATPLAWDWQATFSGRKQRIARGEFIITGDGVTGADNAPMNRPAAWSNRLSPTAGMQTGATLTFGDDVVSITIDGANLAIAASERATDAMNAAALSAATAMAAGRYFTTRAAGEAGSTSGQLFSTDDGAGNVIFYKRTAGGSTEIGRALTPQSLAASAGATKVGYGGVTVNDALTAHAAQLSRVRLTPEDYGATGYLTSDAAQAGVDSTAALQAMANAGAALGLPVTGNGRWYKVGTVSWPSGTRCSDLRLFVRNSTTDVQPVLIDGRQTPKSDYVFTNLEIHGNRLGQTQLGYDSDGNPSNSSGTDGQRHGVAIQGRVSGVILDCPKIWYCAGDGIWIYHDGNEQLLPSGVDDLFARNITIREPDIQWNGRHGGASESLDGLTIVGGIITRNGYDMPGYPKLPYSDGGNGRTTNFYAGPKYGRGWDCESYLLGSRYKNHLLEGIDARGNWGGSFLFYHRKHPSVASDYCENIIVRDCQVDDNHGASGDGCLTTFGLNDSTNTQYAGIDAFRTVRFINNRCSDNYINIANANDIEVRGGWANITTSVGYSVIFSASADVRFCDVPSNKPVFGRPMAIMRSGTATTSGWSVSGETLEFRRDLPNGAARYRYTASVTPSASGQAKFTVTFTPGYKLTPSKPSSINSSSGNLVLSDAFPSGDGVNAIDFYLVANGLNATSFVMEFDAERIS